MVLDELEEKKEKIIENHKNRMIEINKELLKRIDEGLKERDTDLSADVGVLDQIKALFHVSTSKGLRMNSNQRLILAEMYFDLQKTNMEAIMADGREGYQSLLNDINTQIETARNELRQTREELKRVDNANKQKDLEKKEEEIMREFNHDI
jgi:prophage DNA circulation protein